MELWNVKSVSKNDDIIGRESWGCSYWYENQTFCMCLCFEKGMNNWKHVIVVLSCLSQKTGCSNGWHSCVWYARPGFESPRCLFFCTNFVIAIKLPACQVLPSHMMTHIIQSACDAKWHLRVMVQPSKHQIQLKTFLIYM